MRKRYCKKCETILTSYESKVCRPCVDKKYMIKIYFEFNTNDIDTIERIFNNRLGNTLGFKINSVDGVYQIS